MRDIDRLLRMQKRASEFHVFSVMEFAQVMQRCAIWAIAADSILLHYK
jgi:hypothetical protein